MANPIDDFLLIKEAQQRKQAGFWSSLSKAFKGDAGSALARMGEQVGDQLPAALAGAGIAAAGVGIGKGIEAIRGRFSKQRDYKAMLSATPGLSKRPADQVQMMFNSVRKMSPTAAGDPITAGSFIDNAMELSGGKAVMPTQSAKMLAEMERNLGQAKKGPGAIMAAFTGGQPDQPAYSMSPSGMSMKTRDRNRAESFGRQFGMSPGGLPPKS